MVTSSQLQIIQSPITSLLPAISIAITVKLDDTNYLVWQFQMKILLESHGILGFVDGSKKCPIRFDTDSDIEGVESCHNPIFYHFILIIIFILFIEKDKKMMIKKLIMMKKQVK
jgi:hypothetical protein